jgi:uncharacterized protein (TIGR02270 family)
LLAATTTPSSPTFNRPPIPVVVMQHAEESAMLRHMRSVLVRAPHVKLHQLGRLDERIAAHLDGLAVAGAYGRRLLQTALAEPGAGEMFAAAVRAIEDRDAQTLDKLLAVAEALPELRRGLGSAFGWVSASALRGIGRALLESASPFRRELGLMSCALHGVDPGPMLDAALADDDASLRGRALQSAGRLGQTSRSESCLRALADADETLHFAAACAALMLGDRGAAVASLHRLALGPDGPDDRAVGLLLKVTDAASTSTLLQRLAEDKRHVRSLIRAIGVAGDPFYVPWLIQQMNDPALTRLAGESFSLIAGLELAYLDMERKPPEGMDFGPNDAPDDDNVAMDEDDSLPWPDPVRIGTWWQAHGSGFVAGKRYFMGEPPSNAHALVVLREGFQRQRSAAAIYLCLMQPGTVLFNTAAPAWRQQWLLRSKAA